MLRTFTDATVSPVLGAMSAVDITFRDWCKFDILGSTVIFVQPAERPSFDEMSWELSFKSFFTELGKAELPSLQLTRQVLQERDQLECIVHGIQPLIMVGLNKIDEIRQKELVLKQMQAEIEAKKNFTYQVNVTKQKKVDLPSGEFVMNCLTCDITCHSSCFIARDDDKYCCEVMDGAGPKNAKCQVCPGRCGWRNHVKLPYKYEFYLAIEERTYEDLKQRYGLAKKNGSEIESMIATMKGNLITRKEEVLKMLQQAQQSIKQLQEISLKPDFLTDMEFIEQLVESEKRDKRPGYLDRINTLNGIRKQTILLRNLEHSGGSPLDKDWWEALLQPT